MAEQLGYISIHRRIKDNWMWTEKREFSKLEAWLDILLSVNHTDAEVVIKFKVYNVKRGESIRSLDTWANSWNWNKSKVRRFLKLLEQQGMISVKNETQTTRLTVCKYDSYQANRNTSEPQVKHKRNGSETEPTPNNNDNNGNNDNNEPILIESVLSPPIGVDPLHFYIAKGFHKVFIGHNPNAKHLKEATVNDWVKTSRLIIENDKTSIDRLLAIKWYFELGAENTKGVDTFYLGTISSISAFRGKNKIGEYKIDNIFKCVFKWLEEDTSRHSEVFKRRDNLLELVAKCQN